MIIYLIIGLIKKKTLYKTNQYFAKPYETLWESSMSKLIDLIILQKQILKNNRN